MNDWTNAFTELHRSDTGQGLVEYALVMALMCFAAAVAVETMAVDLNNALMGISKALSAAIP